MASERGRRLTSLAVGQEGIVLRVLDEDPGRARRLEALGVTRGARIRLLQRFPGYVFECDETELAVESAVAHAILLERTSTLSSV